LAFDGEVLKITARQDRALERAFPWVDRLAQYARMESWLIANANRRVRKLAAFAHNWFAKIPKPAEEGTSGPWFGEVKPCEYEEWTCSECGRTQRSKKGYLRVCDECRAPN
jgi:hypothetical protein